MIIWVGKYIKFGLVYATNLFLTPKNSYRKLFWLQLLAQKCSVEFYLHVQGEMQSAMDASYPSGWYLMIFAFIS